MQNVIELSTAPVTMRRPRSLATSKQEVSASDVVIVSPTPSTLPCSTTSTPHNRPPRLDRGASDSPPTHPKGADVPLY